ncbi:MAG: nucleotidyltransferase domain-containing protein [Actinomycetota bacterium]
MTVFWLDSQEALYRLGEAARRALAEDDTVRGIYLFGSLAQGRAVPGSDADILVLLDRSDRRFVDRPLDLLPHFEEVGLSVDLFCYTQKELAGTPFAREALEEGKPLAERARS